MYTGYAFASECPHKASNFQFASMYDGEGDDEGDYYDTSKVNCDGYQTLKCTYSDSTDNVTKHGCFKTINNHDLKNRGWILDEPSEDFCFSDNPKYCRYINIRPN